jgi:sortase A
MSAWTLIRQNDWLRESRMLRRAQLVALLAGVLALSYSAFVYLDASYFQARQSSSFDRALGAKRPSRWALLLSRLTGHAFDASKPRFPVGIPGSVIGRLEIPRLRISTMVAEGDSTWVLQRAVGHVPGTALPGMSGNIALAAHRDTFFRVLRGIRLHDQIHFTTLGGNYQYEVELIEVVPPTETKVLDQTGAPELTLVTCYPFSYIGSAPDRFVVRAREIARQPADPQKNAGVRPVALPLK